MRSAGTSTVSRPDFGSKAAIKLGGMSILQGGVAKPGDEPRSSSHVGVVFKSSHGECAGILASSSQRPRDESCFKSCWLFRNAPSAMVSTSSFGSFSSRRLDPGDGTDGCTGDARARSRARWEDRRRGVRQASGAGSCTSFAIAGVKDHVGVETGATGCARNTGTGTSRRGLQTSGRGAKSTRSSVLQPALERGSPGVEHSLVAVKGGAVSEHALEGGCEH